MQFWIFVLAITSCIIKLQCSKVLYMKDLCQHSSSARLQLIFGQEFPSLSLHLTKGKYPKGFNCCVNVSSDANLAAEISTVKLRMDFQTQKCLDSLLIVTDRDQVDFCQEGDLTKQDSSHASYVIETEKDMMICFYSSNKEINSYDTDYEDYDTFPTIRPYRFTVRIFTFASVKNNEYCQKKFEGFLCKGSHRCLPKTLVCNGEEDCPQGQDEENSECSDGIEDGPEESATKVVPVQNFLLISVCFVIIVLISCLWYFLPRLFHCRNLPYSASENSEPRSDRIIMRRINPAENSIAAVTSSPPEYATSVTIVSVLPQQRQPQTASQSVYEENNFPHEQPPPSYESLFGRQTQKTEDPKTNS